MCGYKKYIFRIIFIVIDNNIQELKLCNYKLKVIVVSFNWYKPQII